WIVYNEDMQPERFVGFVLVWIGLACTFADTIRNSDNRAARANDEAAAARGS
ncbi:MAG: EamA family transporter RarD, partial [Acidimicrobiia bacterium]|nr:EamA family transporter RarD [Acidimicrobiia bacterium]